MPVPDIKMSQYWCKALRETLQSELRRTVQLAEWSTHDSKVAAVVNDVTTLPLFHAWKHSLDQSQSSKEIDFEQLFGHVDGYRFQNGTHS